MTVADKIWVAEKLKLHIFYNLVVRKTEMETSWYHWNLAASVRIEVLAAVLQKIQFFWDVMLTTDWQTEADISKVGSAFILNFRHRASSI